MQAKSRGLVAALLVMVAACSDGGDSSGLPVVEPRGTAITNVTVIDAPNGVRENQTVVFEGDEILSVSPADESAPALEEIDGAGRFLIPGLWDMHIHLTSAQFFDGSILPLLLSYGITSVRDTGGFLEDVLPLVEQSEQEGEFAPRIFYAGPLLDGEFVVYDGSSLFRPKTGTANTMAEQAQETVSSLKEAGASFIKIYEMVSPEVFAALVAAANEAGLPIAAHVPLSTQASTAGAQINSMEHLRNVLLDCAGNSAELLDERLALLENPEGLLGGNLRSSIHADQRPKALANYDEARCENTIEALSTTLQVPTLSLNERIMKPYFRDDWQDALNRLPEPARSIWDNFGEQAANADDGSPVPNQDEEITFAERQFMLLSRMHEKGVPIAAGTDVPVPPAIPGYNLHLELAILVRAGMTPLEAIGAATQRPAQFFGLEDTMGSIDVGKRADMLLLDYNPLADIENTRKIFTVITRGRVLNADDIEMLIQRSANPLP